MSGRKVLIVEDDLTTLNSLKMLLELEDFTVDTAPDLTTAKKKLGKHYYPLLLLDLLLPDGNGMELLSVVDTKKIKIIVLTAHGDVSTAVEAVKRGAFDFLEKPVTAKKLVKVMDRALEEIGGGKGDGAEKEKILEELIGNSPAARRLKEEIRRLAAEDKNLLIRGEEGVGKSFVAELVHKLSGRSEYPLVKVSVGGKSEFELERELFGSRIPKREKEGAFERARGGTVVLIGVEKLPPRVQERLLHALKEKRFTPLGENREYFLNSRIISTTSKNLYEMVEAGKFSGELLTLLDESELEIPPLRERKEDVFPLLEHFIEMFASERGYEKPILSEEVFEFLKNYDFPGNVRELKNLAERLVLLFHGKVVGVSDLKLGGEEKKEDLFSIENWRAAKKRFEREYLKRKLIEAGGDVKKVAKMINLDISNVYRKIKEYGLEEFLKNR